MNYDFEIVYYFCKLLVHKPEQFEDEFSSSATFNYIRIKDIKTGAYVSYSSPFSNIKRYYLFPQLFEKYKNFTRNAMLKRQNYYEEIERKERFNNFKDNYRYYTSSQYKEVDDGSY